MSSGGAKMIAKPKERLRLELRRRAAHQRAAPQPLSDEDPRVDPHRRMLNVILGTNLPMTPTRPERTGRTSRDEVGQVRVRARERCHPSRGVTPQDRSRDVLQDVHICTFGPFGPTSWGLTTNGARQRPGSGDPGPAEASGGREMSRYRDSVSDHHRRVPAREGRSS